jgi:hypothetical protein
MFDTNTVTAVMIFPTISIARLKGFRVKTRPMAGQTARATSPCSSANHRSLTHLSGLARNAGVANPRTCTEDDMANHLAMTVVPFDLSGEPQEVCRVRDPKKLCHLVLDVKMGLRFTNMLSEFW